MNTGRYGNMNRTNNPLAETGYLKAFYSLKSDFTTIQERAFSNTQALGDVLTIATDHAWVAGKEPFALFARADTLEAGGETAGEIGSLRTIWKPKVFVKGDGPKVEEIINNMLNEEGILFVQDGCNSLTYIQFGCECSPCEVTKRGFISGTLAGGQKGSEIEFRSFCKFFYIGTMAFRA